MRAHICCMAVCALLVAGLTACGGKTTPQTDGGRGAAVAQADPFFAGDKRALTDILPLYKGCICSLPSKAVYELDKVLEKNPANAYALGLKALALSQIDQFDKAFDAVSTAILLTPAPQLYSWRALILTRANNMHGAARDVDYALRYNPQDPVGLLVRGQLHLRAGQMDAGCTRLREACDLGECSGWEAATVAGQCAR